MRWQVQRKPLIRSNLIFATNVCHHINSDPSWSDVVHFNSFIMVLPPCSFQPMEAYNTSTLFCSSCTNLKNGELLRSEVLLVSSLGSTCTHSSEGGFVIIIHYLVILDADSRLTFMLLLSLQNGSPHLMLSKAEGLRWEYLVKAAVAWYIR